MTSATRSGPLDPATVSASTDRGDADIALTDGPAASPDAETPTPHADDRAEVTPPATTTVAADGIDWRLAVLAALFVLLVLAVARRRRDDEDTGDLQNGEGGV